MKLRVGLLLITMLFSLAAKCERQYTADPKDVDNYENSFIDGDVDLFKELFKKGMNPHSVDSVGSTILHDISIMDDQWNEKHDQILEMFIKAGFELNSLKDGNMSLSKTVLMRAVDGGNYKMAKKLLELGADVNFVVTYPGIAGSVSALSVAINDPDKYKFIMPYNPDPMDKGTCATYIESHRSFRGQRYMRQFISQGKVDEKYCQQVERCRWGTCQ